MARLESIQSGAHLGAQVNNRTDHREHVASPWLTAAGALAYLGLTSRTSLNHAMRELRLPYHRLGRHLRFYTPELDAWLLETGTGAGPVIARKAR